MVILILQLLSMFQFEFTWTSHCPADVTKWITIYTTVYSSSMINRESYKPFHSSLANKGPSFSKNSSTKEQSHELAFPISKTMFDTSVWDFTTYWKTKSMTSTQKLIDRHHGKTSMPKMQWPWKAQMYKTWTCVRSFSPRQNGNVLIILRFALSLKASELLLIQGRPAVTKLHNDRPSAIFINLLAV